MVNLNQNAYVDGEMYGLYATEQGRTSDMNARWYSTRLDVSFSLEASSMIHSTPEPETYAMVLAGLGLMGIAARRRKRKAESATAYTV